MKATCPACRNIGEIPTTPNGHLDWLRCPSCNGTGEVEERGLGIDTPNEHDDARCGWTGLGTCPVCGCEVGRIL